MKRAISICACALALAATASAQIAADRCGALNNRPAPIWGEIGTGLSIQDAFDAMVWAGPAVKCERQQTRHSVFRPGRDRTVLFTFAGGHHFVETNLLGVYEVRDPSNKVVVFEGAGIKRGDQVLLTFMPNGNVYRNGQLVGQNFSSCFGIYLEVYGGTPLAGGDPFPDTLDWTHYSEDALNLEGTAQMLAYRGYNTTWMYIPGAFHIDPWLFADDEILMGVEDLPLYPIPPGTLMADRSYNEIVFCMQGVKVARRQAGFVGF